VAPAPLPVPVVVVGNLVVGGAGKTPTVIALVRQLRAWGFTPGIVSRGHGRASEVPMVLDGAALSSTTARDVGDEPLLMHCRTGVPVAVGRARRDAVSQLLAAHPDVDVVVADDGLQHHALPRDLEIVVFDGRGLGNGRVLPAGPLREPAEALFPSPGSGTGQESAVPRLVLLNGPWPAPPAAPLPAAPALTWAAERSLAGAVVLADWTHGAPPDPAALDALAARQGLVAAAGIGHPARFFDMLEARGLRIARRLPLPDHDPLDVLPWPADTADVLVTEKDAVKLAGRPTGATRVWVVPLDFDFPPAFADALRAALDRAIARRAATAASHAPDLP
jgi:tetraacyldisaccharide 4'-kinase